MRMASHAGQVAVFPAANLTTKWSTLVRSFRVLDINGKLRSGYLRSALQ
jgi:hypothetical protein